MDQTYKILTMHKLSLWLYRYSEYIDSLCYNQFTNQCMHVLIV